MMTGTAFGSNTRCVIMSALLHPWASRLLESKARRVGRSLVERMLLISKETLCLTWPLNFHIVGFSECCLLKALLVRVLR